ncbi:acyl carrier protein [Tsukamurella ocularis]|uniref:acyl carrier protein n=1 Tax=Tsukamurella ocularis TaxID=1970234 RepID=UPI00216A966C|nr:acyl carrier protein [Tsukamurella ocularis]MCS3779332.1 acyl carrier protein [Tsukamurella ocularis]MCS3789942.1 acyl carrier protein [Tsukamurella ocularis]MCS3852439.1 acyl carrier protein [Tsukamurella ocularis]
MTAADITPVEIDKKLREIVVDVFEIGDPQSLTLTSSFVDDHEGDSLGMIEIASRVEADLAIVIPTERLESVDNLGDLIRVVVGN